MSRTEPRRVRTFVVRLWREPMGSGNGAWEWRGEVRDALTEDRRFFRRLRGIVRALAGMLGQDGSTRDR